MARAIGALLRQRQSCRRRSRTFGDSCEGNVGSAPAHSSFEPEGTRNMSQSAMQKIAKLEAVRGTLNIAVREDRVRALCRSAD